jgi:hypothetical protein
VALRQPKLGEAVAFRRTFVAIDPGSLADEVSIEAKIREAGYSFHYAADSLVYNHGPETVADYLRQRTRIHRGHSAVHHDTGYAAATMRPALLAKACLSVAGRQPVRVPLIGIAAGLEAWARLNVRLPRRHRAETGNAGVWQPITSAKRSFDVVIDLTEGAAQPATVGAERMVEAV